MKKFVILFLISNLVYSHNPNNHINQHNIINPSYRSTLGDINNDGLINIQDIILLVNFVLNNEYIELGDLNSDGKINILDIVNLVNIILHGPADGECVEEDYSTVGVLTDLSENVYNDDESVNAYSIYSWTCDEVDRILSGNGIPNHEVGTFPDPDCPNTISEQNVNHNKWTKR